MTSEALETVLILPDLPNKSLCGIDLLSFTTSPRFLGIKHIPVGWHFVFNAVDDFLSIRHGVWFYISGITPELHIKAWNSTAEELYAQTDTAVRAQWQSRLPTIWREGLTPYRQAVPKSSSSNEIVDEEAPTLLEERNHWPQLTSSITSELLTRITGPTAPDANHYPLTSASSSAQDFDTIPGLSPPSNGVTSEGELGLLPINLKQTWRPGAVGRERTTAAQDRSWALRQLVAEHCGGDMDQVLGEMQFCFLMVLTLNNSSCLEQWKRILGLLLTCTVAAVEENGFFESVLALLKTQLEYALDVEAGLFDLSEHGGKMLKGLLVKFRKGLEETGLAGSGKGNVLNALDELEEYLKAEWDWSLNSDYVRRGMLELEDGEQVEMDMNGADEEDETGDYAPVIVDLTPEQLRQLDQQTGTKLSLNPKRGELARQAVKQDESESEDDQELEDMDARF